MARGYIEIDLSDIQCQQHETFDSAFDAYITGFEGAVALPGEDIADTDLPDGMGVCDIEGNEFFVSDDDLRADMRAAPLWGFADTRTRTVHHWFASGLSRDQKIWFFAHELSHIVFEARDTHPDSGVDEEWRADYIAAIAVKAQELARLTDAVRPDSPA